MDDAAPGAPALDWFHLASHAVGGVCLLNYSLAAVSRALRAAFGPRLREAIKRATRTRALAFATGVAVTALLSSATASTLLVLAFVEAGDMSLQQSLGIGLGIGLGSTLNAHLIAFSLHRYAMAMIAVGYTAHSWAGGGGGGGGSAAPRPVAASLGEAVFGLGLLFASTAAISTALAPLKSYAPFVDFLAGLHNPVTSLAVAAAAAVAFQSSNTVIAIVIMLAQGGFLSTEGCCALVLGANVGTSVTPVLAALGRRREVLRVAVAFLAVRAAGLAALLPLLGRFVALVTWVTAGAHARAVAAAAATAAAGGGGGGGGDAAARAQQLAALARAAVMPAQVAAAHSLANAWVAVACMPFLGLVAATVTRWLPGEEHAAGDGGAEGGGDGALAGGGAGGGGAGGSSGGSSGSSLGSLLLHSGAAPAAGAALLHAPGGGGLPTPASTGGGRLLSKLKGSALDVGAWSSSGGGTGGAGSGDSGGSQGSSGYGASATATLHHLHHHPGHAESGGVHARRR
jgi:Na/Pi-cotransporter